MDILLQSHQKGRGLTFSPPFMTIYGQSGGLVIGYIHPAKSGHETSVCSRDQISVFRVR